MGDDAQSQIDIQSEPNTELSDLEEVEEYETPEGLSYVGQAAVEVLTAQHLRYREVCWNVTHGKSVGELAQTPPVDYWRDKQIDGDLENCHSDCLPERMGEIIARAEDWVDFTSLGAPTGKFLESIAKALRGLSDSGRSITVRFLTGNIIGMPTDNAALLKQLTQFPGYELPEDTSLRLWVGSWRKGLSWNHSKIIAVDGKYLFTGGHNVWDPHYLQKNPVRDVSMELEGQVTQDGHVFANRMWRYIVKKDQQYWLQKDLPGWVPTIRKGRISVCRFPQAADAYPPQYERPEPVPLADAVAEGSLPMISIGRYGSLHASGITANPSDSAVVAMLRSAQKSIKLSLQDLGPLAIPPPLGPKAIPSGVWPKDYLREIACAIYERGVDVHICVSTPNSIPADLTPLDANYGNGWTCEDVAAEVVKAIREQFPDADEEQLTGLVGVNLRIAYVRGSCGSSDWLERGGKTGNHAKFFIIDDMSYYVGSQNLYIANLAEWGVVVDSEAQTREILEEYWDRLWASSFEDVPEEERDCNVDNVLAGLNMDRNPVDESEYTPEELEAVLLAKKAGKMGGSGHTLTVWLKRAHNLKNADGVAGGSSDSYVRLRVVDSNGKTVGHARESKVIEDGGKNPHWNEQFDFVGLERPCSCTLKLTVLDQDSLLGLGGVIADDLVADDKLGSASVDLGTLANSRNFQDMELIIADGWFSDSTLSIALTTQGGWGN